jgi:hypothetical protein
MWKPLLSALALAVLATASTHAAAQVFSGPVPLEIDGKKRDCSFILRVSGAHLSGWFYVDGIPRRMTVSGPVRPNGRFHARIAGVDGIAGRIAGKVDQRLTARGSLHIPGFGSDRFNLASHPLQNAPPGFEGTFTAVRDRLQSRLVEKVTIDIKKRPALSKLPSDLPVTIRYDFTITVYSPFESEPLTANGTGSSKLFSGGEGVAFYGESNFSKPVSRSRPFVCNVIIDRRDYSSATQFTISVNYEMLSGVIPVRSTLTGFEVR